MVKLNGLLKMSDHPLIKLCHAAPQLEHLELTKCEAITEYSIDNIIRNNTSLKFIDLNAIPAITPQVLE